MSDQQSATNQPEQTTPAPTSNREKVILALQAIGIGLLFALGIGLFKLTQHPQFQAFYLGLDQMRTPLAVLALTLLSLVGAAIWIRPRFQTVATVTAGLFVLFIALSWVVRIDSFYGGMVPRFAWRWSPTAEERFAQFQTEQATQQDDEPAMIDLTPTAADFPGFLGRAARDGVIDGVALETDWSAHAPRELWRHPVGLGWGGFSVAGQAAITQEQRGEEEAIVCYDLKTGREIWAYTSPVRFVDEHGDGPRANPTIVAGRVYCMGATGLLTCLNGADGTKIWDAQTLNDPQSQNLLWGMSGSPLVIDGKVIVTPGGAAGRSIVAYDAEDGTELFSGGDDPAGYASPVQVSMAGKNIYLSFNGAGLRGFDEAGKPLWLHPWLTQGESQRVNVAQPIVLNSFDGAAENAGHVVISSGYGMGAALLRVTHEGDQWSVEEVWRSRHLKSKMSNFVQRDGFLYGMDNGIMACVDAVTGKRKWKQGRYGHGQLLLVGDVLLVQAESGEVALVQASPEGHNELARLEALSDKTWNNATLAGNILLIRNDREAAAYELPLRQNQDLATTR